MHVSRVPTYHVLASLLGLQPCYSHWEYVAWCKQKAAEKNKAIFTHPDSLVLCASVFFPEAGEGVPQHLPGDRLATAGLSHDHHPVTGVLGLVELDDLGDGDVDHLQVGQP